MIKHLGGLALAMGLVLASTAADAQCTTERSGNRSVTNCNGVITERHGNRSVTYGRDGTVTERHGTRSRTYGRDYTTYRNGARSRTYYERPYDRRRW
jgi:hypothetical protein